MSRKKYRVWYGRGQATGLMTRRQAIDLFNIFDDAVRVEKAVGWWKRTIRWRRVLTLTRGTYVTFMIEMDRRVREDWKEDAECRECGDTGVIPIMCCSGNITSPDPCSCRGQPVDFGPCECPKGTEVKW